MAKIITIKTNKRRARQRTTRVAEPIAAATQKRDGPGRPPGRKNNPKPKSPDGPYMTIDQYCADRFISRATYVKRHQHKLRGLVKFGNRVLIPREEALRHDQEFAMD